MHVHVGHCISMGQYPHKSIAKAANFEFTVIAMAQNQIRFHTFSYSAFSSLARPCNYKKSVGLEVIYILVTVCGT